MDCEICRIIEKHGLSPSAHDWWHCTHAKRGCPVRMRVLGWHHSRDRFKIRWPRFASTPRPEVSRPRAIGRELKFLSYSLATHISAHLR